MSQRDKMIEKLVRKFSGQNPLSRKMQTTYTEQNEDPKKSEVRDEIFNEMKKRPYSS
jgi:hypothetical protein